VGMNKKELKDLRIAVANYMGSEGCDCCRGENHGIHKEILAKLLKVPRYKDRSGYNFAKFRREI